MNLGFFCCSGDDTISGGGHLLIQTRVTSAAVSHEGKEGSHSESFSPCSFPSCSDFLYGKQELQLHRKALKIVASSQFLNFQDS